MNCYCAQFDDKVEINIKNQIVQMEDDDWVYLPKSCTTTKFDYQMNFTRRLSRELSILGCIMNYNRIQKRGVHHIGSVFGNNKLIQGIILLHNIHTPHSKLYVNHNFFTVEE